MSIPADKTDLGGYYESEWKGYRKWCCARCPFDAMVESKVQVHVYEQHYLKDLHQAKPETRPLAARLYDASGREITDIEA